MHATLAVLSEPNRFRIVELLKDGPLAVNDIVTELHLGQPQVSKHLRVLKDAGIVDVRPGSPPQYTAQQRLYALRPEPLRDLNEWIERFRAVWDAHYDRLDDYLEKMKKKKRTK